MTERRAAQIIVTFELLADVLRLPDGAAVFGVAMTQDDLAKEQCRIFVKHPNLPRVAEGAELQWVHPEYEKVLVPESYAINLLSWGID